ncbi:uncharacterized protein LOC111882278 isoform X1 [Lactuca sativa]|nr:uncharacterized protein LOC111882278 isoform X1 [Lactuca sativa]
MDFRYARPPPPPPPSSDPHQRPPQQPVPPPPGTWYSGQFQYHSPSPPPPQWAQQPQHPDHHLPPPYAVAPPPPMPYSSNPYPLPPRPHMPLPPPQPHYPPVNQEWSNTNWGHQGWDHSAAHNKNEDDWAARARAWAASKTVTDDQHQHQHPQLNPATRPEETNYQGQYTQNLDPPYTEFQQHPLPPSNYQQYPSSFPPPPRTPANNLQEPSSFTSGYASDGNFSYTARDGNLRDPAAAFPHQEPAPTSLSAHQQEVPSSYSSVAGKEDSRETNGKFYQPSHLPFASAPQHQIPPPISPRDRLISIEQPHYSFSNPSIDPTTDLSNQPLDFGPRFSHDHDPTGAISTGMHLTPSFGRSSFQPTMASGNATFPIGASNAFHVTSGFPIDTYGTPGFPERNKKVSVPNWLREEIIKKKAVIGTEISRQDTESNEDEVMEGSLGKGDQVDGKSMSTEEEDDVEDYVEAARTAAINQEIKRILTEVLLKVTDELFDEIATKVLEEDELSVEVEHKPIASSDMPPAIPTPKSSSAKVLLIPAKTKGTDADDSRNSNSSSPGDVLGLGNYASDDDDDDEEKEVQNPSSINSKPTENGSSHVDGSKFLEKESDSHGVSPNGKSSSQTDADHVTQEHRNHDSGGDEKVSDDKHELFIDGISDKNLLPNDSQGKNTDKRKLDSKDYNGEVDANANAKVDEDEKEKEKEKNTKKGNKDDRNGNKDKIKDQRFSKSENKKETERERRSHGKEDGRKRERTKDEKNERSSKSRHKRHHSPSSDTSSDDSRRKVHSRRRNSSPSPVRSRRQVSRSPPSKRSQHRHNNYSSLETTRERKRSRSRSRRG